MRQRDPPDAQHLKPEVIREAAIANGVCVGPIMQRLVDTVTGREQLVPIDCGSTRDRQCPTCAERNRRLRMQQCREGWHTAEETLPPLAEPDDEEDEDQEREGEPDDSARRVRSTRRRQDVPDLPRLPVEHRSIGRAFVGNDGRTYRPSMFNTVTLPSYGRVRSDGTPVDPATYDYRRAALDAMHFAKGVDRLIQNLRRCAGYKVQHFGCVEAQRRLAPHFHYAMRRGHSRGGCFSRPSTRRTTRCGGRASTNPPAPAPVCLCGTTEQADTSIPATVCRCRPGSRPSMRSMTIPSAAPMHVLRFGKQTDYQGLLGGTRDSERRIGYLTKYLTTSITDTYGDDDEVGARQRAHVDRLHQEVRWLPCTPRCANWLRFGIQPDEAEPGLVPGECEHNAHQRENAGFGGEATGWPVRAT